jgi:hypothetical protein
MGSLCVSFVIKVIAIQKAYNIAKHYNLKLKVHKLCYSSEKIMKCHFKHGGFRNNKSQKTIL